MGSSSGLLALYVVGPSGRGVSAAPWAASSWHAEAGGDLSGPIGGDRGFVVSATGFARLVDAYSRSSLQISSAVQGTNLFAGAVVSAFLAAFLSKYFFLMAARDRFGNCCCTASRGLSSSGSSVSLSPW